MNITFYNVSDNPKKLEKDITNVIGTARALAPTGQINVLNPVVVVAWDSTNGDSIINANYAYIDTFHRYYFITCGIDTAKRIVVSGKCDYLMSWADSIKQCPANIVRADLGRPTYTIDKKYPVNPTRFIFQGVDFDSSPYFRDEGNSHPYVVITR